MIGLRFTSGLLPALMETMEHGYFTDFHSMTPS